MVIDPAYATSGGRIDVHLPPGSYDPVQMPAVFVGEARARVVAASSSTLGVLVPDEADGGRTPVRVEGTSAEVGYVEIGRLIATGVHQVDSPAFDRAGNLFVTYSGARGERVPMSIFRIRPDGQRESFVSGIVNPTSMTCDAEGNLFVSSRFDGSVSRVSPDGDVTTVGSDLGLACGLAFAADGGLYVGDRSGTVFHLSLSGKTEVVATLPPSVAAFHLAMGRDGCLYVTGPTLGTYDHVYRIDTAGHVEIVCSGFGRPQGLAFDAAARLYVVEALAGASGLFRVNADGTIERIVSGRGFVGVAFDPRSGVVVSGNETVWRFDVPHFPS
jgi:sugar lactone lactonase YvrE